MINAPYILTQRAKHLDEDNSESQGEFAMGTPDDDETC